MTLGVELSNSDPRFGKEVFQTGFSPLMPRLYLFLHANGMGPLEEMSIRRFDPQFSMKLSQTMEVRALVRTVHGNLRFYRRTSISETGVGFDTCEDDE